MPLFPREIGTLGVAASMLLALTVSWVSAEASEERFEIIGDGTATDISADGSVIVGRSEEGLEAWRWSRESGRIMLGNGVSPPSEGDPGTPDVSNDGRMVSATLFHEEDPPGGFPGVWQDGSGWTRQDKRRLGVVWGMSDDARMLVGLVWDDTEKTGAARAAAWIPGEDVILLGDPGRNSRANDASQDGKVVVGWSEDPDTGTWQPTAWTDDGMTILAATKAFCEATAVSPDGTIIVGQSYDEFLNQRGAALWLKSDFGWVQEDLGTLSGTFAGYGYAAALDLSESGRVIVGVNKFDWDRSTGFLWTPNSGMQDIRDYLAGQGITIPSGFTIDAVTAISDDGLVITGHGRSREEWPTRTKSFLARISGEGSGLAGQSPQQHPDEIPDLFDLDPWRRQPVRGRVVPD